MEDIMFRFNRARKDEPKPKKWKCKLCDLTFLLPATPMIWEVAVMQNKMAWHQQEKHPGWPQSQDGSSPAS